MIQLNGLDDIFLVNHIGVSCGLVRMHQTLLS